MIIYFYEQILEEFIMHRNLALWTFVFFPKRFLEFSSLALCTKQNFCATSVLTYDKKCGLIMSDCESFFIFVSFYYV